MTAWADVVTGNLLGGISQILDNPVPLSPVRGGPVPLSPHPPQPAIVDRGDISPEQRAVLKYQGIDPDTAPLDDINRGLGLPKQAPAPTGTPPPQSPPPGTPPAGTNGTPPITPVGDGKDGDSQLSGAAADAAKRLDETLGKHRSAINDADEKLADAILKAQSSSEAGKAKLKELQQSIIDQVQKLGPTLDTQAGQEQLAEFLRGKASEILDVANKADLDAKSHAALLDGVAAQLDAIGADDHKPDDKGAQQGTPGQPGQQTGGDQPATPPTPGTPGETGLPSDPLLGGGLPSDPLMQGLGSLLGPASALPQMLGGMMPNMGGGGGGLPLGDIGSQIGSAIRGGAADAPKDPLADPAVNEQRSKTETKDNQNGDLKDPPVGENKNTPTNPAAGPAGTTTPNAPEAQTGQATPAAPAAEDLKIKLPSGDTVTADNAAIAHAGRDVLAGKSIDDSYRNAGLTMSPPGAPITKNMVSRSEGLVFGDIGQFTDHRVMALGEDKVWDNGREIPLKDLRVGPTFLGWERPQAPQPVATAPAPTPPPPAPSNK